MAVASPPAHRSPFSKLPRPRLDRRLTHYPALPARTLYLAVTVVATVSLYYELYLFGGIGTKLLSHFGYSFAAFVGVTVISSAAGAFASLFAGFADRYGRANIVVAGLLLNGVLITTVVAHASSRAEFTIANVVVGVVEGIALVATPALIRDFSPQSGRGVAMGFWAMGPVLGSLTVTEVTSHTLDAHPSWQYQYELCGIVGLAVGAVAFVLLRELAPALRDQLIVDTSDLALVEARARGLDVSELESHTWRDVLRPRIVGSAASIVLFLAGYFIVVGFLVIYLATTFGYTEARANALGNWYWVANAIALLVGGVASDKLRVRKPFMLVGALVSIVGTALFAAAATHPNTSHAHFVACLVVIAAGGGVVYAAWMAAFTETVEARNPAAIPTGLAVWGWVLRILVGALFAVLPLIVHTATTIVDKGPRVQSIVARYPDQVKVLQGVDPATLTALQRDAHDRSAQVSALSELTHLPRAAVSAAVVHGTRVSHAGDKLNALSKVPQADLDYLSAYGTRATRILDRYPRQIAVLQRLDKGTQAKLNANADDVAAQRSALAQLSGLPVATVTAAMTEGPRVQAAGNRLKAVQSVPAADLRELQLYGTRIDAILARYPAQIALIQKVGAARVAALGRAPDSVSAQARAIASLTGLPTSSISRVITLSTRDKTELATAQALSPSTAAALKANRSDLKAIAAAQKQIAAKLHVGTAAALTRLVALSKVPTADLDLLQSDGPKVQAAGARLQTINSVPRADLSLLQAHGTSVQRIAARYPSQVATLKDVDASTLATLNRAPSDVAAQSKAISELTGLPVGTVSAVVAHGTQVQSAGDRLRTVQSVPRADLAFLAKHATRLQSIRSRYPAQVRTLAAVDPATLRALDKDKTDVAAQASATAQLTGLPVSTTRAVVADGPRVQAAGRRLSSLSKVPASDTAYLAANGTKVATAQSRSGGEWQHLWLICLAGQLLFLPLILLLRGRWNPRRAREDAAAHDREVARELERLRRTT